MQKSTHAPFGQLRTGAVLASAIALTACASVATATLENRFQAIGIPAGTADCMVGDLSENLSNDDLQDLARYTVGLSRANSTAAAIQSLLNIDNPRAVVAVGKAGFSCVTGFGR